jgi:hypothetical protein
VQLQGPGFGAAAGDVNPKLGLDAVLLDSLFERPSAELVSICVLSAAPPLLSCSVYRSETS